VSKLCSPLIGRLVACVAFFWLGLTCAQAEDLVKPHDFSAGQPARAAEVNANFDALYQALNEARAQIEALQQRLDAVDVPEVVVTIATNLGDIVVALDPGKSPVSVANFLAYVDSGFYTDTIFHRVMPGFVIQGGGFDASLTQKPPNAPIVNEALNGLRNARGTIAMARTGAIDSASSQFYFNLVDNRALDPLVNGASLSSLQGYAVFGRVIAGMDVVDAIAGVSTSTQNGMEDVPDTPVVILSVTRN
jgi:peptidyl-prolyl cis-trans isomerase A (cyclophilin A)